MHEKTRRRARARLLNTNQLIFAETDAYHSYIIRLMLLWKNSRSSALSRMCPMGMFNSNHFHSPPINGLVINDFSKALARSDNRLRCLSAAHGHRTCPSQPALEHVVIHQHAFSCTHALLDAVPPLGHPVKTNQIWHARAREINTLRPKQVAYIKPCICMNKHRPLPT